MPSFFYALIALVLMGSTASATAISSVQQAFWQADFAWYDDGTTKSTSLPDGVVLTCTGTATAEANGCRDSATANVVSSDGAWLVTVIDRIGGLKLENTGARSLGGVFAFTARFASFYPAAPDSGASVDDGAMESADYFTVVQGAGGFDLHGCNMASAPGHSGPHACRPMPATLQESVFTLGPSADWTEMAADWRIYIQVTAQGGANANASVPEPASLALFLTAAGFTACRRKARSPSRQSRRRSWSTER